MIEAAGGARGRAAPGGDATMSVARANLLALAWLPGAALLVLLPFALIWGPAPLAGAFATPLGLALAAVAAGVVVHELCHALGFLAFGGAPRQSVRVGVSRRTLTPFAACSAPVSAAAYRAAALLPAVALGVLPAAWSLVNGSAALAAWAFVMLAVAGGDLAAVWAIRRLPASARVLDHPTRVGCSVVEG